MERGADASLAAEKKRLRALVIARRAEMSEEARRIASRRAADTLLSLLQPPPGIVSLFLPMAEEIDPRPAIERIHASGGAIALPVVTGKRTHLDFRRWAPGEPLIPGVWNIPEPPPSAPSVEPDVVIVPLVAFDRRGGRLGYGAGFFDRTLAVHRARKPLRAIGFAFACQEVEAVPIEAHDEPLDAIVTENGVVTPRAAG